MEESPPLDVERLLTALVAFGVEFVVVGGIAVVLHGRQRATFDLDICYDRSQHNARALLRALNALHATLRGDATFPPDVRALPLGDVFTFRTEAGNLDCLAAPDGTTGFDDLAPNAVIADLGGCSVRLTSLDDVIRMKEASGRKPNRGKDRDDLEALRFIRQARIERTP